MEQTMCPPSPALCQPAPVRGAAPPAHRATGHRSARGGLRLAPGCQRLALDVSFPQNFDFFFLSPALSAHVGAANSFRSKPAPGRGLLGAVAGCGRAGRSFEGKGQKQKPSRLPRFPFCAAGSLPY